MTERRRYTRKQKLSVVMAAEMVGVTAAAEQAGIPVETASYWIHRPEFAEFRSKARADLEEEVRVVAHMAWKRVAETLPHMEPRDALFAADKASTLLQLVSGQATDRHEVRDVTGNLDDHERAQLADAIDAWLAEVKA